MKLIICGDLNAQVGGRSELDDETIIGTEGYGVRTGRGETLVRWATAHGMAITSTFCKEEHDGGWTWNKGPYTRQLDYVVVESFLFNGHQ